MSPKTDKQTDIKITSKRQVSQSPDRISQSPQQPVFGKPHRANQLYGPDYDGNERRY